MEEKLIIDGPTFLNGEIDVEGSKNAALPILTASILAKGQVIIKNVPDIADVRHTLRILEYLGCKTEFENDIAFIDPASVDKFTIPPQYAKMMRSSILFLGAILSKFRKVRLTNYPGGV
ncbi:hypothetical protein [Caldicellulosiruptor naganoensis]|uniref:UDP-N-acetylglucosamine 1-carboxyvinyltransferase n=1 Tax=Caldicellulosiruptor naganoensis TaxID=29324 RepID=A0ABY7BGV8_9FIRM|nr:hypothetical protein [Caldicellulosiruptor naganoensis]WAM31112.1 hypothetical protein OTJ99_001927 [Caldicellulosiruptor naganoensis]